MNIIQQIEREQATALLAKRPVPDFAPGDLVRVNVRVVEGTRERVQAYEGICIGRSGGGLNESFTVRKISYGEGVERVFPVLAPTIESIVVVRRGRVRRAKLYYLRGLRGKAARIPEKQDFKFKKADGKILKFKKPKVGGADDLTLINGIDAPMARKLNGIGIIQYVQLVNLTDDEIGQIDEVLKLNDRFEREDWAGQAKVLMAETTADEVPAEDEVTADEAKSEA